MTRIGMLAAALLLTQTGLTTTALAQSADDQFQAGVTAFSRDGNRSAARMAFLKAIELDGRHAGARFNLAMLSEEEEQWGEAIRYYNEYLGLVGQDDLYADVARRKVAALSQFETLDRTPEGKSERIFLQLVQRAQSKLASADVGAALALSELAIQQRGDRFEGHLVQGVALMEAERYTEAQQHLDKARGLAPAESTTEIQGLLQKAQKLAMSQVKVKQADEAFAAKNYAAAGDAYGQAWTVADAPEFGIQAARSWSLAGDSAKALKIYDVLVQSPDPGIAATAREERGQVSILTRDAGSAAPLQRPEYARARELVTAGKYYEADAQLTLVLDGLMPDRGYSALYEARGMARVGLREFPGAVGDFTVALLLDPARAAIYEKRAAAYASLNRHDEAAADIASAIERTTGDTSRLQALRNDYRSKMRP